MHFLRRLRGSLIYSPSRAITGLMLGLGCAVMIQVMVSAGWFDGLERESQDFLFNARGQRYASPHIVQVVADNETIAHYKTWPLPRGAYARTVEILKRAGAKTIAIDILFSESSQRNADDKALIQASKYAKNVVQACAFHVQNRYNPTLPAFASGLTGRFAKRFELRDFVGLQKSPLWEERIPAAVWVSAALPQLRSSAPLIGHINIHPRRDGSLRAIPHVISYRDKLYPSLALGAAAHFLGVRANQIKVTQRQIEIAGRDLPLDSYGETLVNWRGINSFPTYSLYKVIDGEVEPEIFKGKVVLIGVTAAGSFEGRATPFSSVQPALDLQATALDNILENRPLRTLDTLPLFVLLLFTSLVTGVLIAPRLEMMGTLLLVGLTVGLWLVARWLLASHDFYLPVAASIVSAALTYALAMAVNYRSEWEANFRTDAAVSALARGGALMATGQTHGRLQTVVRAATRDALGAEEIFLVQVNKGNEGENDELLAAIATQLQTRRRATIYPCPGRVARAEQPFVPDAELRKLLAALAKRSGLKPHTVMAAPLLHTRGVAAGETQAAFDTHSALIAVGSRDHRTFGLRDVILLEAIAKQAGLAFENLEYSELLQGRIELANRDLRDAYIVLAEQSSKFMAAVEGIDDALVICDSNGYAVFVNSGADTTLREATPLLAHSVPETLRREKLDAIAALFDCLNLQEPGSLVEPVRCEEIWRKDENDDEQQRVLSSQLTPLYADGERLLGAMLLVSDITAQREVDQMKTDFVSFVAHELRSPLGAILGYASLLEQYGEQTDLQTRGEMASAISRQCHRLNRLISDLLDISRLDAGHALELRRERVELRGLVEKVLDAQRAALSNPAIALEVVSEEPSPSVWGDPDRLEQVLVNLISNAVKYSPEGGRIETRIEDQGNWVSIKVSDEGMGMSVEQVDSLFQKFYRTPDARRRGIKGTGLGLFLVKNLIEAHRGHVEVISETGKGTTFSILLPRRTGEQMPGAEWESDETAPGSVNGSGLIKSQTTHG